MSSVEPELARPPQWRPRGRRVLFLIPLIVVMALTTIFPIGYASFLSFFDWNWGSRFNFVGFGNYVELMGNGDYWWSVARTFIFAVSAVAFELVLGLALAVVVHRLSRGLGWVRTALMLPMMVSGMVVSLVWKIMLDPTLGVLPALLGKLGINGVNLLGDPQVALLTIAGIDTWWQTGFVFIVLSASLGALPEECFEAARVDGANALQSFWSITLPLLRPTVLIVAAIRMVDCLKVFALIYGTTEGGPQNATEVTQILVYRRAFKEFAMSESMTMMLVYSALVVGGIAVAYLIARKVGSREA